MHHLSLPTPPENWHSSVATFGKANPCEESLSENIRWNRFVDECRELVASLKRILEQNQYGLCAYCERETTPNDRQIEHIRPKSTSSPGHDLTLDLSNMVLCCLGGTAKTKATAGQTKRERRQNYSCGEAKGKNTLPISPYHLPLYPLFAAKISIFDKELTFTPDADACERAGISIADVDIALGLLNLNCPRLKRARYAVWKTLEDSIANILGNVTSAEIRDKHLQRLVSFYSKMQKAYATTSLLCLRRWLPGKYFDKEIS